MMIRKKKINKEKLADKIYNKYCKKYSRLMFICGFYMLSISFVLHEYDSKIVKYSIMSFGVLLVLWGFMSRANAFLLAIREVNSDYSGDGA